MSCPSPRREAILHRAECAGYQSYSFKEVACSWMPGYSEIEPTQHQAGASLASARCGRIWACVYEYRVNCRVAGNPETGDKTSFEDTSPLTGNFLAGYTGRGSVPREEAAYRELLLQ
jgi:hypothetical protein